MNKRFSTLLAAALVAGGFSFNAMAADIATKDLKQGQFIHLSTATGGTTYLAMDEKGNFSTVDASDWSGKIDKLLGSLWQVKLIPNPSPAGTIYTYSFTNRMSGQLLSVKLQSNVAGGGRAAIAGTAPVAADEIAANEKGGNTEWAYEKGKGFYVVKGDSIFTIGTSSTGCLTFAAKKATTAPDNATMYLGDVSTSAVTLNASDFNALVKAEAGRLFFTDENVSSTEKNVLTANKWKAVDAKIATDGSDFAAGGKEVLYLTNGKEYKNRLNVAMDKADATQKEYLLVDYNFYDPDKAFNVLKADTIAVEPAKATVSGLAARTKIAKHHPATAAFTIEYFIPNDSLVIAPAFVQTSIPVATTLEAMHTALPSDGEIFGVRTAVGSLKTGVALFSTMGKATDFPKGAKFATVKKFTATGTAGADKTGQDLINAVKEAIKGVTYAEDAATKKKQEAYVAAVNKYLTALSGLEITKVSDDSNAALVSTSAIKDGSNYADGLSNLTVEAVSPEKQIVIRKLSNTKVLTIGQIEDENMHGNLIATIKTSNKDVTIGGDAVIAEGLYYVIDAAKEASAGVANKYYGFYFDESPVNTTIKYVAKAQAFNPFAQYVVAKAAGVNKGNYTITNRGDETEGWQGVTNVADKDNNIYVIEGDTIQLVAAKDVAADNAYIGFKYITANDAINNKFTITSAADVLEGQSIVMAKDSSLKVMTPEDEVLYTLVPSAEGKYGVGKSLKKVTYTVMNADSAFVIYDSERGYVFSNGKYETKNGTPANFTMIAVDTDSTFVLYDATNSQKLVVSTQYKTISGEGLDARNDMFIVKAQAAPASYKSLPKHIRVQAANGDFAAVNTDNQGVAVREGDLKSDAYSNLDFIFWLDTAKYTDAAPYKYYVTKGVKAEGETPASRMYMWNAKDSVDKAKDKTPYLAGTATRVLFRTASIMSQDTLLVPTMNGVAKIDTVSFAENKESKDGLKHAVKAGLNSYQFSFVLADKDVEGEYNIVDGDKNYVHSQNGVLVMGDEKDALVVNILNVSADDVIATDNEQINANGVKVIATEGAVTIKGAQGKAVVITNVLGQTIAQTVLSSDNETIAAPAGVVVVAVEGEAAVKAIVK